MYLWMLNAVETHTEYAVSSLPLLTISLISTDTLAILQNYIINSRICYWVTAATIATTTSSALMPSSTCNNKQTIGILNRELWFVP